MPAISGFNGGRSVDTTFVWKTAGDIATIVTADAVGNGINLQRRDTITVAARTTQNIEIRF